MCIANICTERSFINNFYDLVQINLGQKGPWVADFPAARFIPNQHNQDLLLHVILVERPTHIQALYFSSYTYSSLIFFSFSNERRIKMWTNWMSKTFIMLTDLAKSIYWFNFESVIGWNYF